MRAIWSGSISFVLVNIPVRLYSAVSDSSINFDLLHKKDFGKIRYRKVCEKEEKEVPFQDIVRGFEYHKGEYVIVPDEELKAADPQKNYAINILDFVNLNEIDPIYFEKPYYLEPEKGADQTYALLREALLKSKKAALGKFVLREREKLVLIRPLGRLLLLNQLRFTSEIKSSSELNLPVSQIRGQELEMAIALIERLSTSFNPTRYKDDYREKVMALIESKSKGEKIHVEVTTPKATHVSELMEKLKKSLAESEKKAAVK